MLVVVFEPLIEGVHQLKRTGPLLQPEACFFESPHEALGIGMALRVVVTRAGLRQEDQELALLALHLLQIAMVYINTLMIQQALTDETWWARMTPEDLRALTPLIYAHVTPYGTFKLDMQERIPSEAA